MTTSEMEMMAFAAKAYGAVWNQGFECFIDPTKPDSMTEGIWLPRTDDGDSFRLMVKMGITVYLFRDCIRADHPSTDFFALVDVAGNPAAAAREAIFQVAVAIGKAMR